MNKLEVFSIKQGSSGEAKWTRAGSAFVNRDGSINVYLDVLPLDGKLYVKGDKLEVESSALRSERIETALRTLVRERKLGREPLAGDWLMATQALEEP